MILKGMTYTSLEYQGNKKTRIEEIFESIIAMYISKLMTDIKPQIQGALRPPRKV